MSDADTPTCPRCGYDQSGAVDSWTDRCPLTGVCAECGLDLEWSVLYDPREQDVPWSAEHARTLRGSFARVPMTALFLVSPWVYWKRMPIVAPVRLRRLLVVSLILVAALHLAASVPIGIERWNGWLSYSYPSLGDFYRDKGFLGLASVLLNPIVMPFMEYNELRDEFTIDLVFYADTYTQQWGWNNWGLRHVTTMGPATNTMRTLATFLSVPFVWFVLLVVVPTTRAQAKVRWAHVARAIAISVVFGIAIAEFARALQSIPSIGLRGNPLNSVVAVSYVLCLLWSLAFWPTAILVGWRVRGAVLFVVLGTIAAVIGMLAFTLIVENAAH